MAVIINEFDIKPDEGRTRRPFENISDADLVSEIAQAHGLTPEVDVSGPTYTFVAQVNQSDLAFVRNRLERIDAELWVEGSTLKVASRAARDNGSIELEFGAGLLECSVMADLSHQRTEVRVCGWDIAAKEGIDEPADAAAVSGELDNGESGASVLEAALGARVERIVAEVPVTSAEAKSIAEAEFRERARRFVIARGLADGNPAVRAGARVTLSGLGEMFCGEYRVTLARHTFDRSQGYRTRFEARRAAIGGAS